MRDGGSTALEMLTLLTLFLLLNSGMCAFLYIVGEASLEVRTLLEWAEGHLSKMLDGW